MASKGRSSAASASAPSSGFDDMADDLPF
jgi:hypothetical protein